MALATPNKNPKFRNWCFTLNNPGPDDAKILMDFFQGSKYRFQEEVGAEGTPHFQGHVSFPSARYFSALQKVNPRIHWEKTKNVFAAEKYVNKSQTATGKYWSSEEDPIEDPLAGLTLYNWQQEIVDLLDTKPDPRKIYYYQDEEGNKGKSDFCKHLLLTRNDVACFTGDTKNLLYYISTLKKIPRIILIDVPRSKEGHMPWVGIEQLKNGLFSITKYESKTIICNKPHIFIFSNYEPEKYKLSLDRWVIKNI